MGKSGFKGLVTKLSVRNKTSAEANSGLTKYLQEASSNYGKFSDTPSVVPSVVGEEEEQGKAEAPQKRASVACDGTDLVDPLASTTMHTMEVNRRRSHGDRARRRAVRRSKSGVAPNQMDANASTSHGKSMPRRIKSTSTKEGSSETVRQESSRKGMKLLPKRCKSNGTPGVQERSSETVDQPSSRKDKKLPPKRCKSNDTVGTRAPGDISSSSKDLPSSSKHSLGTRPGRRRRSAETDAKRLSSSTHHGRKRTSDKSATTSLSKSVHGRSRVKHRGPVGCDGTDVGPERMETSKRTSNATRDRSKKRDLVKRTKSSDNDVSRSSRGGTRRRNPLVELEDVLQETKLVPEDAVATAISEPMATIELPWTPSTGMALSQTKVQTHKVTTQEFDKPKSLELFQSMGESSTSRPTVTDESQGDDSSIGVSEDGDFSEDGDDFSFSEDGDSSAFAIDIDESEYNDSDYDTSTGDLYDGPVPLRYARRATMSSYGRHTLDHGSVAIDLGYGDLSSDNINNVKAKVQASLGYEHMKHLECGTPLVAERPRTRDDMSVTRRLGSDTFEAPKEHANRNRRASMGSYHSRTAPTAMEPAVSNKISTTLKEINMRNASLSLVSDHHSTLKLAFDDPAYAGFASVTKYGVATDQRSCRTPDEKLFACQVTDMIAAASKTSLKHRSSSMRFLNAATESATMHEPVKHDVRHGDEDRMGTSNPRHLMPRRSSSMRFLSVANEFVTVHEPLKRDTRKPGEHDRKGAPKLRQKMPGRSKSLRFLTVHDEPLTHNARKESGEPNKKGTSNLSFLRDHANLKVPFDDASTFASFSMTSVSTGTSRRASIGC